MVIGEVAAVVSEVMLVLLTATVAQVPAGNALLLVSPLYDA
jgi:hypothetical protein